MKSYILFFDGHCNLCNYLVNFIIKRDMQKQIKFCPIQQVHLHSLSNSLLSNLSGESAVLYDQNEARIFQKSEAVFEIAYILGGVWKSISIGRILPRKINDLFYDCIAKNRFKIFGQKQECRIPSSEERGRFL